MLSLFIGPFANITTVSNITVSVLSLLMLFKRHGCGIRSTLLTLITFEFQILVMLNMLLQQVFISQDLFASLPGTNKTFAFVMHTLVFLNLRRELEILVANITNMNELKMSLAMLEHCFVTRKVCGTTLCTIVT